MVTWSRLARVLWDTHSDFVSYGTRILTLPLKIESEGEVEVSPSIGGKTTSFEKSANETFGHHIRSLFGGLNFNGSNLAIVPVLWGSILGVVDPAPEVVPAAVEISSLVGDVLFCVKDEGTGVVFEDGGLDEGFGVG